mgnify:CR=1 FL=1
MAIAGIQFVSTPTGIKTGVLIDLKRYRQIWEDVYDQIVAESRKDEPRVPWEGVKKRLKARRVRGG